MNSLPDTDFMPTDVSSLTDSFFNENQTPANTFRKPGFIKNHFSKIKKIFNKINWNYFKKWHSEGRTRYIFLSIVDAALILIIILNGIKPAQRMIAPLITQNPNELKSLTQSKGGYEVFGFAPYWTFDKLDNVDFKTLTTFSYFGVDVDGAGNLDKEGSGYETFMSDKATKIFKKAHQNGTRVVLTLTQMRNGPILSLMDDEQAQQNVINQAVAEVKNRGIDGINVDFEFTGDPGQDYRDKFSTFVENLTQKMHEEIPSSRVTVSVYASAIKEPKIYDIQKLGKSSDGIFMMAYDFAVAASDNAIPTAPLYGHKEGKYWFDVSTAVDQFLTQMPASKLILGVPWYGYNYPVYEPEVKAETLGWGGRATAQTYTIVKDEVTPQREDISEFKEGWDDYGKVGYKAYYVPDYGTWRMVFIDDPRSLSIKYDYAKDKNLGGVGMWALGFDDGKTDMWTLLKDKFGQKDLADNAFINKKINE